MESNQQSARRERLAFARTIAREGGAVANSHFRRSGLSIEWKADASPVTNADRETEQYLRACIQAAYPDDAILGEEFAELPGTSGYRWILDPIDGTKSFMHGVPLFGTMVGVEYGGRSVVGVVEFPALGEAMWAAVGEGAYCQYFGEADPRRAQVSTTSHLAEALFLTNDANGFEKIDRLDVHERLRRAVRMNRGWSDCYAYFLVATGRADFVVDPKMSVWDCAAIAPIIEEAGGAFVDWEGTPGIWADRTVGSNPYLLPEVLRLIRG